MFYEKITALFNNVARGAADLCSMLIVSYKCMSVRPSVHAMHLLNGRGNNERKYCFYTNIPYKYGIFKNICDEIYLKIIILHVSSAPYKL
jgi:hypothetical protein